MISIPVLFAEFRSFVDGWVVGLFGNVAWKDLAVSIIIWVFVITVILVLLSTFLVAIKKIVEFWKEVIVPHRYNSDERRKQFRRHMFADHVEGEVRFLNSQESWNDNRFTELEAHVEAEGVRKLFGIATFGIFKKPSFRLEKSLAKAIENSTDRLVLLEGDPGSGKSVALRHVAQTMARKAMKTKNLKTRIPLYINLKYLRRTEEEVIDRNLIKKFVFRTLNRANDRDVNEYLQDEFNYGMEEGTWFFLFDSFDEIPEILSSTGSDDVIRQYAEAIRDLLHGINNCKGIVASREYKGPRFLGWPRFRILPLKTSRKYELVKRTGLPIDVQQGIIQGLIGSGDDFRILASNPMFLNLICDYMNKPIMPEFPSHIFVVFKEYIQKRLTRDDERVQQRFNKTSQEIQSAAEKLSFCMTGDKSIGLSPTLVQLRKSTEDMGFDLGADFEILAEALAYLKLARIDVSYIDGSKTFTFAHRRFQEYFATAVALREPDRVSNYELLANGRWRETAVVIFQTQQHDQIQSLINAANELLISHIKEFGQDFVNFNNRLSDDQVDSTPLPRFRLFSLMRFVFETSEQSTTRIRSYLESATKIYETQKRKVKINEPKKWSPGLYHLLSLLQEGFSGGKTYLSFDLQENINKTLMYLSANGDFLDEKWCLELSGISSQDYLIEFITKGIGRNSRVMSEIAFRQVAKLTSIPNYLAKFIKRKILEMAVSNQLFASRHELYAQLSRLQDADDYTQVAKILAWAPIVDLALLLLGTILLLSISMKLLVWELGLLMCINRSKAHSKTG